MVLAAYDKHLVERSAVDFREMSLSVYIENSCVTSRGFFWGVFGLIRGWAKRARENRGDSGEIMIGDGV